MFTGDNLAVFILLSCRPQPVQRITSSRAQRGSAQSVRPTATPTAGERRCVRVAPRTCVQIRTAPTPRAPVSTHSTGLGPTRPSLGWCHSLPCCCSLQFAFSISGVVSLFLWCHPGFSNLPCVLCAPCWALTCVAFVVGCWGLGAFFPPKQALMVSSDTSVQIQEFQFSRIVCCVNGRDFVIRCTFKLAAKRMWNNAKPRARDGFCSLQVWFQWQLGLTFVPPAVTDNYNYKGFILIINRLIWPFLRHSMLVYKIACVILCTSLVLSICLWRFLIKWDLIVKL